MQTQLHKLLLGTSVFMAFAISSSAQVTTSGITGFISDSGNQPVPGATVKAIHQSSGTVYNTITQANGNYSIQGMRPGGPYMVVLTNIGFSPDTAKDVYLSLGENFILNEKMVEEESDLEGVTIVANNNPILAGDRTGASTRLNNKTLNQLPTINRSLTDFTRLTPQANGNGFAGRDGRYNNMQIDGANFNNGFGLSSDALPGGGNQPVSLDAIEEVSVNIAPYDVRQTGFTGAGINAVTRSGTNEFTGSVYGYLRPRSFTGLNVEDNKLSDRSRNKNVNAGFRIGGPIIKNKLFFFANFEYENRQSNGNNWLAARPGLTGSDVTSVQASDLEAVSNYLKTKYGYDPGAYENYANNYFTKNTKALVRLDWNINEKNKFTIRYNQMLGSSFGEANGNSGPNPRSGVNRVSNKSVTFENGNYTNKNKVFSLTAELNSTITSKISNQLIATYSRIQDTRATPGSLFPFVDIGNGDTVKGNYTNYMSFGTELFSYNNDVINNNYSVTDNLSYTTGKHNFTAGLSFQLMNYGNSYMREGASYYRYYNVSDFLAGAAPISYATTYPYAGNDGYARVNFGLMGAYVQDRIAVNPKLNVTIGLRADMQLFLDNPPSNPAADTLTLLNEKGKPTHYSTGNWPKSVPLLSPRVGFNYDALGNGKLKVRGGTGIFTGNIPFVWFTNMPTNAGVIQAQFEPVDKGTLAQITHLEADPAYWPNHLTNSFPNSPSSKPPSGVNYVSPDFKMPQVWRTNIGADYKLPGLPLIATGDVIFSKDINAIYQFNANRKAATETLNYSGDDRDLWTNTNAARYNNAVGAVIPVLSNTSKGYSMAATAGITLTNWKGFSGTLFYTYSLSKDISGNPGSAAGSAWSNNYSVNDPNEQRLGYSQFAVPHRIVGSLSYRKEYLNHLATTVSLVYTGSSQGRFAYTYSNDINNDGVTLDLLYLPTNPLDLKFVDYTAKNSDGSSVTVDAATQYKAYQMFVNNDRNLSNNLGGYAERNNGLLPWLNRWDFRLLQDIFVTDNNKGRRHTLQFSLDILNLGNLLNKNWGIRQELNNGSLYNYGLLKVVSTSADGVPTFNMNYILDANGKVVLPTSPFRSSFSTNSTWGMQVGLRYSF
ncbi:cell envelope biogenesis protein OmpA [Taibaiella lutea]|uniref:Cell envelope biogenesis protein OmpA n=1 Tax=Taibaiella lutea TaxID=2608001 RepID=A0A5M6CMR8_9BACT|nr:carboxypeptidase regulatory-like domain-containing protein [Taibaiella lutea]KAA5534595.1 cell envelope biogenesis protein OmpA [Taibaiella lutea]